MVLLQWFRVANTVKRVTLSIRNVTRPFSLWLPDNGEIKETVTLTVDKLIDTDRLSGADNTNLVPRV